MTSTPDRIAALKDFLRGFGRNNQEALQRLSRFDDWRRVAATELERRATQLVESLDDETLRPIAAGDIDLNAVCRDVASELTPKGA